MTAGSASAILKTLLASQIRVKGKNICRSCKQIENASSDRDSLPSAVFKLSAGSGNDGPNLIWSLKEACQNKIKY